MNCHFCDKEATVHLTEIVNGQMVELHLCEDHAKEKGADFMQPFSASDFLASFSEIFASPAALSESAKMVCPSCGMSYPDFSKSGRLGCGSCYDAFGKVLLPLIKRVQRSTIHQGKRPLPGGKKGDVKSQVRSELHKLQGKLKQAVAAENYEEAAKLRDAIQNLEKKLTAD